jgi:hypothetical protein
MVSMGKAVVMWAALSSAGAGGGFIARGRYDRKAMDAIAFGALKLEMVTGSPRTQEYIFREGPEPPPTREERDAELRCVVYDPEAIALPATVEAVLPRGESYSRFYELLLSTAKGPFKIDWRPGKVPKAGRQGELFGRIAHRGPFDGALTRLEPGWFEPAGTIARVGKAKVR